MKIPNKQLIMIQVLITCDTILFPHSCLFFPLFTWPNFCRIQKLYCGTHCVCVIYFFVSFSAVSIWHLDPFWTASVLFLLPIRCVLSFFATLIDGKLRNSYVMDSFSDCFYYICFVFYSTIYCCQTNAHTYTRTHIEMQLAPRETSRSVLLSIVGVIVVVAVTWHIH